MRLQIGKSQIWLVLFISLVALIILLNHITTNLTPEQASWIIAQLPGASDLFDKTITFSNGYKLSTSSNTSLFKLLPRSAKRVQSDLAAFDVFLSSQEFHYPEDMDFYPENKPRQIVISLASMPQRYFVLVDPQSNKEVGSVGVTSVVTP